MTYTGRDRFVSIAACAIALRLNKPASTSLLRYPCGAVVGMLDASHEKDSKRWSRSSDEALAFILFPTLVSYSSVAARPDIQEVAVSPKVVQACTRLQVVIPKSCQKVYRCYISFGVTCCELKKEIWELVSKDERVKDSGCARLSTLDAGCEGFCRPRGIRSFNLKSSTTHTECRYDGRPSHRYCRKPRRSGRRSAEIDR
ncbi:uncharacterized protein M421DRAFT_238891 [Didymella exigua CBS 183.55]|uniref:Uncharacterized protein n=1 Tax=Didymella exigua CBS 183.55 TaxID=1150837 RepID=A0A6A5RDL3_9PLEO|nr:uncharacterized protein M421DRAFT_238891 [Didymella exigua CBS 183.55]KAF1925543.1 hypothetical protein M421DRAFT_238891 [Didymella exigua CBS 183.55]